jgi:hypothetical protein
LFAVVTAWFSRANGRVKGVLDWPFDKEFPSFPLSGMPKGTRLRPPKTILACRYDLYLQHGPVLCEEKAGTGVQLVDGRVQKISVLWKDGTPTHLQPRMDIFRLKPSFAQ